MLPLNWLYEARDRIRPYIEVTPLTFDSDHNIYIKWENKQVTGSFKARGAINKMLSLNTWERENGVVAASAGNHGQGVALAGKITGTTAQIFIPKQTPKIKIDAMINLGAEIHLVDGGYDAAENQGLLHAYNTGRTWISPYNDGQVIAGQGTIALEVLEELNSSDDFTWIVPSSGGGLLSGISIALEIATHKMQLVAVQSETSPFLYAIYHFGTQEGVDELPTIAEGLAGAVENGSVTIPIIKSRVDDFILVSEEEIKSAIAYCWYKYNEPIEGAAAVSFAAILSNKVTSRPAILIISGGNIQPELHQHIILSYI